MEVLVHLIHELNLVPNKLAFAKGDRRAVAMSVDVLDRELEQEQSHEPGGPRIRCPLCGWSPRKDDRWFCTCGQ
jgi:hypothetical protein